MISKLVMGRKHLDPLFTSFDRVNTKTSCFIAVGAVNALWVDRFGELVN